ncbi:MAG: hypothetical protein ACE14T_08995 [Syntrophales bacterium]
MRITDGTEDCWVCRTEKSVIYCDGCGKPLCRECRKFDLWGYGCGHVDTKVFCAVCYNDIQINPYGGERD